jgi:steroid delta-isomerase-like uncharacterized protein
MTRQLMIGLVLVMALLVVGLPIAAPQAESTTEATRAALTRLFEEAWTNGDYTVVDELVAEDYQGYFPAAILPEPLAGHEGFIFHIEGYRMGISDMTVTLDDLIVEGNKAATRFTITGTHDGIFFGVPGTGQEMTTKLNAVYHFNDDGLLEAEWFEWDTATTLFALGFASPVAPQQ